MRIGILEDDPDQLALLTHWLRPEGHDIHGWLTGRDAMKVAARESFDLYILDWQVPDVSGVEVLAWLRTKVAPKTPVLFTTVRDAESDIVYALNQGADDYMIKPLRKAELLARLNALLRRAYPPSEEKQLSFPPFTLDLQTGEIRREGNRVGLTHKEFEVAAVLFRNLGRLLSRGYLQEAVWGRSAHIATRTIDTHISQVRKKLDLHDNAGYRVVPVYNYGYRLEKTAAAQAGAASR